MSSSSPTPKGPGSVSGAPNLPEGFTGTFTSRSIDTGDVRLHAVTGGDGPPVLLIHGWPGSWYYWRLVMPALARDFSVIAVDQRGIGLSDKPEEGYDAGTLANDLAGLMDVLGRQRFALVGVDTGMLIGYALAADHPDRVVRLAVGEAPLPGITPPTPLIAGFGTAGYATGRDLTAITRASFWALLALIVFGIVLVFVNVPGGALIYSVPGLVIFAGFTMFDFQRIRLSGDIRSAALLAGSIFLDILNLFLFFLQLFPREE